MQNMIRLDTDMWDDVGIWELLEYNRRPNSTGVHLTLSRDGITTQRVVSEHQIEWIDE